MTYAGFWKRFVASLLDGIILTAIGFGLGLVLMLVGAGVLAEPIGYVLGFLYYPVLESSSWQATIGKRMIGIRVTDLEGRRISFWRSLLRNVAKYISALILGIGFIMAGLTDRKQALHDMIAGCLVVNGNAPVAA